MVAERFCAESKLVKTKMCPALSRSVQVGRQVTYEAVEGALKGPRKVRPYLPMYLPSYSGVT